jgi:hypothetical protein
MMKLHPDRPKLTAALLLLLMLVLSACSFGLNRNAEPTPNPNFGGTALGDIVTAGAIGGQNEPRDERDTFSTDDPIIYAVAEATRIEPGTAVFARWTRNGEPFEDSPTITSDQLYEDIYIEFHIEPTGGTALVPGDYSVQFYVNGNPGPSTDFTVQ